MNSNTPSTASRSEEDFSHIFADTPSRIDDVITRWVESSPHHSALEEASGTWTYKQLDEVIHSTQQWLKDSGIRPGDRVMIVGENCRSFVAVLLAVAALDAWPVLVNARLSANEVDAIREHAGARRVVFTTTTSHHTREHAKRHGAPTIEIAGLGAIALGPLNEAAEPEAIDSNISCRVAAVIYTSGTTGLPKGVMLTHRNLLFLAAGSARIRLLRPEDHMYGILPISHAVGLSVILLGTLLSGATLHLASRFDPVAALAAFKKYRITVLVGAPAMFSLLVEYAKLKGIQSFDFSALRILASSSAPLDFALKSQVEHLFGQVLHNGYGVTECSPTIAQTRPESPQTDTSVGPVFPGVEIKLVGADQEPVPEGEVGELWVRGPNVMKGYYRAPEETAAAINPDGWFNTRDLARLQDGNLFITGRTKELIVRFGFNVYPVEVEATLNSHPAVSRSAVIGRSIEGSEGGEDVIAFIQLLPDSTISTAELEHYAAQHLAPYKRPSQIILISEMPLTPTGKIAKAELAKLVGHNAR
jgi:long-chain acyl-CoA synthetase